METLWVTRLEFLSWACYALWKLSAEQRARRDAIQNSRPSIIQSQNTLSESEWTGSECTWSDMAFKILRQHDADSNKASSFSISFLPSEDDDCFSSGSGTITTTATASLVLENKCLLREVGAGTRSLCAYMNFGAATTTADASSSIANGYSEPETPKRNRWRLAIALNTFRTFQSSLNVRHRSDDRPESGNQNATTVNRSLMRVCWEPDWLIVYRYDFFFNECYTNKIINDQISEKLARSSAMVEDTTITTSPSEPVISVVRESHPRQALINAGSSDSIPKTDQRPTASERFDAAMEADLDTGDYDDDGHSHPLPKLSKKLIREVLFTPKVIHIELSADVRHIRRKMPRLRRI
jgi:hypothetical protein